MCVCIERRGARKIANWSKFSGQGKQVNASSTLCLGFGVEKLRVIFWVNVFWAEGLRWVWMWFDVLTSFALENEHANVVEFW